MTPFEPHPLLRGPHWMTIAAAFWPRRLARLPPGTERLFETEPGTRLLAQCNWQHEPRPCPTLLLVHGLEGSIQSGYMLGTAEKAFAAGFNAVRLNQRNCGGTEHLTPTLYNSGLSGDLRAVVLELAERDALPEIFVAGFSMGGNLALKMAGEFAAGPPAQLRGVAGVAPALDLAACADAIAEPRNRLYQCNFVHGLIARFRRKVRLFPERYSLARLNGLGPFSTLRAIDDAITAPLSGYRDAEDYYYRASALRVVAHIRVPTLLLTAQDDTFVPFRSFADPAVTSNPHITLLAPPRGGHCGFISSSGGEERFWAEARVVEFCRQHSALLPRNRD